MVLVDASTGMEAEPVLVDSTTGKRAEGPNYVFTAGPAASKPFRDRYASRPPCRQRPVSVSDQLSLGPTSRDFPQPARMPPLSSRARCHGPHRCVVRWRVTSSPQSVGAGRILTWSSCYRYFWTVNPDKIVTWAKRSAEWSGSACWRAR